jgi:hypothetical protein
MLLTTLNDRKMTTKHDRKKRAANDRINNKKNKRAPPAGTRVGREAMDNIAKQDSDDEASERVFADIHITQLTSLPEVLKTSFISGVLISGMDNACVCIVEVKPLHFHFKLPNDGEIVEAVW